MMFPLKGGCPLPPLRHIWELNCGPQIHPNPPSPDLLLGLSEWETNRNAAGLGDSGFGEENMCQFSMIESCILHHLYIYISSFYSYFNDPSLTHCRQDPDVLIPIDDRHRSSPRPRTPLIKQMAEEIRNLRSKAPHHLGTNGPEMVQRIWICSQGREENWWCKKILTGSDEYCGNICIFASVHTIAIDYMHPRNRNMNMVFVSVRSGQAAWNGNLAQKFALPSWQVAIQRLGEKWNRILQYLYVLLGIKWRSGGVVQPLFRTNKSTAPIFGFDDREFVNISWWSTEARG